VLICRRGRVAVMASDSDGALQALNEARQIATDLAVGAESLLAKKLLELEKKIRAIGSSRVPSDGDL
jgi:hypothetical protein